MGSIRTFQALRLHGNRDIRLDEVESLPCGPHEVRLKIAYCGICGSDIHEFVAGPLFCPQAGTTDPYTGIGLPVTLGHEMSGSIVEVGSNVHHLHPGQKVCVNPSIHDAHYGVEPCSTCKIGRANICKRWSTYGLSGSGGGFADEIVLNALNCIPLPEGVSLKIGALTEPFAVAWHCVRISGFVPGQDVLVLGAGPIGLALLAVLRARGARKIIVSEIAEQRARQARELGADVVINPLEKKPDGRGEQQQSKRSSEQDPVTLAIHDMLGDGVDIAYDASGLQSTLDTAIRSVKSVGTIFNVAIHEKPLMINLNQLAVGEKRLMAGAAYTNEDFMPVLDMMTAGTKMFESFVSAVVPLRDIVQGGFQELMDHKDRHLKILIQPESNSDGEKNVPGIES
ncbi:hypothetical protein AYL99_08571 [Fonsecaea erecta]|uniref:Enoyl reductase (ER) domain-containing protein n=1 Tax=Fonsecaea erecta TaxID=1367422 RepID=A0A178ZF70_9EURO|nr:hypothetical protein AYL99_08571 [Fonsecaea erecta]OAP57833.1 hypothetical protein AYL99_08571 [Fonsecaea erecta]